MKFPEPILSGKEPFVKYKNRYFASCPKGMFDLLKEEMKSFSFENLNEIPGGIYFEGPTLEVLEFLMRTRIASRIYKCLYGFYIQNEKDIYFEAKKIKWKALMDIEQTFKVQTNITRSPNEKRYSKFRNSMILSQRLKDALCDWFREKTENRPNVDKEFPDITYSLHIHPLDNPHSKKEEVTLSVDLCGDPLSHRGYRAQTSDAPLRENLAAAIVLNTNWDKKSTFIDTMCGSGTFLAEALLIKGKIPPSYLNILEGRAWAFVDLPLYQKDKKLQEDINELVAKLKKETEDGFENLKKSNKIYGYDVSRDAINISKRNLGKAKLLDFVHLEVKDALELEPKKENGVVICNPPFGERLGDEKQLEDFYHLYGENLKKNFKGYSTYIFTSNPNLRKKISLQTSKRVPFWNGNLECRLLQYDIH